MTVRLGILALLEAKPGKGDELAAFLEAGRALAVAEEGTVTWSSAVQSAERYRPIPEDFAVTQLASL